MLDRVPRVLLSAEDARVLTDARTSADVLEALTSAPVSVVLVGNTGVGKSHLLNDLVGLEVSEVGVVRPTTTSIVMAGSYGPAAVDHASEYVYAPEAPAGMAIMDTPAWETDRPAVAAAIQDADVGVLVVSPSRYADATTRNLWDAMQDIPEKVVVLNRQRGTVDERGEILASVREHFAPAQVVVVDEAGESGSLLEDIRVRAANTSPDDGREAIVRAAAVEAGRHVAGAVTAAAMDLGQLANAVESVARPEMSSRGLAVRESWLATEQELVDRVGRLVDEFDRVVVDSADNELAGRMLTSMRRWRSTTVEEEMTAWRNDAADRFRAGAVFRWRRSFTENLLDQTSWKAGVNPSVRIPKRVIRVMGSNLGPAILQANGHLVSIADHAVVARRDVWQAAIDAAGSFMPGELLGAADVLGRR